MATTSSSRPGMSRRTILVLWLVSMLPAALFVGLVVRSDARKAGFVKLAQGRAEGTVIRLVEVRGKHTRFHPVVAFTTAEGRRVEFKSIYSDYLSFGEKRYALGGKVSVVYVPEDPARAEVDEPALHASDAAPIVAGGGLYAGFMTLVFGALALFRKPRAPAAQPGGPISPS